MSKTVLAATAAVEQERIPRFEELVRPQDFQLANGHVFPSLGSLVWFARVHRDELRAAGAVVMIGGRMFLRAPVFMAKAEEIGARLARSRGALR